MRVAQIACVLIAAPVLAHAQAPALSYWHMWTGDDGKSHLTKCAMSGFTQQSSKQWLLKAPGQANVAFAVDPKGDWHENPVVQWVVPIQGAFFVQTQDGAQATLLPGDLLLGEDLDTKPDGDGHKGHISASRGDKPVALMFAQFGDKATVGRPCRVK